MSVDPWFEEYQARALLVTPLSLARMQLVFALRMWLYLRGGSA